MVENWFMFGIILKIPYPEMKRIEAQYRGDIEKCKLEVLQFWLQMNSGSSPKKMACYLVLSLRISNYNKLADAMQNKYGISSEDTSCKS